MTTIYANGVTTRTIHHLSLGDIVGAGNMRYRLVLSFTGTSAMLDSLPVMPVVTATAAVTVGDLIDLGALGFHEVRPHETSGCGWTRIHIAKVLS